MDAVKDRKLGHPDWDGLYETAQSQEGIFTTRQAARSGYSPQLLTHHVKAGKILRVRRGVYRVVHFPPGEHEHLVTIWAWSDGHAVFSHETALFLHELSDAMPAKVHITLPKSWKHRRLRLPEGLMTHFASVAASSRAWVHCVPVTDPLRTVRDCVRDRVNPEYVEQATSEGLRRGLFTKSMLDRAEAAERKRGLARETP